jgi:hypothetical protein
MAHNALQLTPRLRALVVACAGLLFVPSLLINAFQEDGPVGASHIVANPKLGRAELSVGRSRVLPEVLPTVPVEPLPPPTATATPEVQIKPMAPPPPVAVAGPEPPSPPPPPAAPPTVAMFTFDRIEENPPPGLDMEAAEKYATNNYGNLLWLYAAPRLLPSNTPFVYYKPGTGNVSTMAPRPAAFLMPTANILYNASTDEGDHYSGLKPEVLGATRGLTSNVRNIDVPLLMIGAGSQPRMTVDLNDPFARETTSKDFQMVPEAVELLHEVAARGPGFTVRGAYTEAVIVAAGINAARALGCPTLMINHAPALGAELALKLSAFAAARNASARIIVTLPASGWPAHLRTGLLQIIAEKMLAPFPNSIVLLQSRGDWSTLKAMAKISGIEFPSGRTRYFYNMAAWIAFMQTADAAIGFRLHGSMSAIAAGVPAILVSTDWRVREVAESHRLPTTTILDPIFAADPNSFDLYDFAAMYAKSFDGAAFDANRATVADGYKRLFAEAGLEVHPALSILASMKN